MRQPDIKCSSIILLEISFNWTSSSGDGIANRMVGGMAEITVGFDEAGKGFIVDYGVNALVTQDGAGA